MALRRPPTRIELKADNDIDEYTTILREREMAMEDLADGDQQGPDAASKPSGGRSVKWSSPSSKKATAAQRIGIGGRPNTTSGR